MRTWFIPLTIALCSSWQSGFADPTPTTAIGPIAPNAPIQKLLHHAARFSHNGYSIKPLADFDIEARVLHVKSYNDDRESQLSPIDFAVGWGPMSDQKVLDHIHIDQGNRFLYWHTNHMPVPRPQIEHNTANLHLIPSDANIARQLKQVTPGQVVQLKGYLVRVDARDGWRWVSSLTRTDVGKGACELLWVQHVSVPARDTIPVRSASLEPNVVHDEGSRPANPVVAKVRD